MEDQHRYRSLVELPEYTAQFDSILARYSDDVIGPVLAGLLWGIATRPQAYGRATWDVRIAKSSSLGLTIPTFRIFFQLQNEGKENEQVLLCWIEETSSIEEMT
jgi:hypothetical protein